jgi:hypothetical protein
MRWRTDTTPNCASCVRFLSDPAAIERCFPGMRALSSAWGSTRGNAGICLITERFHDPIAACAEYEGQTGPATPGGHGYDAVTGVRGAI